MQHLVSPSRIAPFAHPATHAPQRMHSSLTTYGIWSTLHYASHRIMQLVHVQLSCIHPVWINLLTNQPDLLGSWGRCGGHSIRHER